jgi:hypothetical protein
MRTTGVDRRTYVVRGRMGNAGPWAERNGGQCDWPQLRQGGRCLQSWVGCGSGSSAHRPSGRGFGGHRFPARTGRRCGPCDWPQLRQGGWCLRSWTGAGPVVQPADAASARHRRRGDSRPGPLPQNIEGLPWPVSPMHGDGLPPSESQIGHSPIPTRRCPQIHRDRPVATCESGKRVLT